MECYVPLEDTAVAAGLAEVKKSHGHRRFVVFDEDLNVIVKYDETQVCFKRFIVTINGTTVLNSRLEEVFYRCEVEKLWALKPNVCSDVLFRSSVVMNNGHNDMIKFSIEYTNASNTEQEMKENGRSGVSDILPSFESVETWGVHNVTEKHSTPMPSPKMVYEVEFPIYSLLNMRLRNTALKAKRFILSSLDFQPSKGSMQMSEKYLHANENDYFQLSFKRILYELVDKAGKLSVDPLCPLPLLPLTVRAQDGYSCAYKLPLISEPNSFHRVKITLLYDFLFHYPDSPQHTLPITTTWETDVTLKKSLSQIPLQASPSAMSTPRLYSSFPRFGMQGSTTSLVNNNNNKLSNTTFRFMDKDATVTLNHTFTLRLKIINLSTATLDLVIYYYSNKNITSSNNTSQTNLAPDKKYQLDGKSRKVAEGIILLSNDYKVPLIEPQETAIIELQFVAIEMGYYPTLAGLKALDLESNELVDIGYGTSVLVTQQGAPTNST